MKRKMLVTMFLIIVYSNLLFCIPDGIYYSNGIQKPDIFFDAEFLGEYRKYLKVVRSRSEKKSTYDHHFSSYHPFLPRKKFVDSERIIILSTNKKNEKIILFEKFGRYKSIGPIKYVTQINIKNNVEIAIGERKFIVNLYENNKKNKIRVEVIAFYNGAEDFYTRKDYIFIEKIDDEKTKNITELENYTQLENEAIDIKKTMKMQTPIYLINKSIDESGSIDLEIEDAVPEYFW
jgi:hypothetical protein